MALQYNTTFPGRVDVDAVNYPLGKPKNVVIKGDGTGTPWEAPLEQDFFGFLQACVAQGNITINELPDTAVVSDYLRGLLKTVRERTAVLDWTQSVGSGPGGGFIDPTDSSDFSPIGAHFDSFKQKWIVCGGLGGVAISRNGGQFFEKFSDGHTSSNQLLAVSGAGTAANRSLVMTDQLQPFVWRTDDFELNTLGSWVQSANLPVAYRLRSVAFEPSTNRYIVIGIATTGGNTDGYFAVSNDALGATYTQKTAPASFAGVTAHQVSVNTTKVFAEINSVSNSDGIARFNFTVGPTMFVGQNVIIAGYANNTGYNTTGIVTVTGAGFFEISSITFGLDETGGSFTSGSVGLAVVTAEGVHTKVAFSTDGGLTWSDSTTTFASKIWRITYSPFRAAFFLMDGEVVGAGVSHELYTSTDGDTWTLVADVDQGGGTVKIEGVISINLIASYGHALVVIGTEDLSTVERNSVICFSFDGGVTWDQIAMSEGVNAGIVSDAVGKRLLMLGGTVGGAYIGRLS